jgi:hypothetical protein
MIGNKIFNHFQQFLVRKGFISFYKKNFDMISENRKDQKFNERILSIEQCNSTG